MAPSLYYIFLSLILAVSPILACPRTFDSDTGLSPRGAIDLPTYLPGWKDAIVPFQRQPGMPAELTATVERAMRLWEQSTCVRFVKRTKGADKQWLNIKELDRRGQCFTETDPDARGEVLLVLGDHHPTAPPCTGLNNAVHELGHVLGLMHEFQRPDRDQFVIVPQGEVDPDEQWRDTGFAIIPDADTYGIPFDEHSCMNYNTVTSIATGQPLVPSEKPTALDYATVNAAYGCDEVYTRALPDMYDAPESPAERWETSTYAFILDHWTDTFMHLNGYTVVGVHQWCSGDAYDSNNWAFTPHAYTMANLRTPHTPYKVEVDRCREGQSRNPAAYEIALCKGESEEQCDIRCGMRYMRPIDPVTKEPTEPKAVELVDNVLWICHPYY